MNSRLILALGTALCSACFEPPVECGPNGDCHHSHENISDDAGDDSGSSSDGRLMDSSVPDGARESGDGSSDGAIVVDPNDGSTGTPCYVDQDGDGVGVGTEIPCTQAPNGQPLVHTNDDCDDLDPKRTPGVDELCDAIDNDCDLDVDEDSLNVCGGPCIAPLAHTPGDACNNGQLGVCARAGTWQCINASAISCNASTIPPGGELCGDGKDNDCDGQTDEPDATNASRWYRDCDGDGFAGTTANYQTSCAKPASDGSCTWTTKEPNPGAKINWDCDDTSTAYAPGKGYGKPPAGKTSWDLNCDGTAEFDNGPLTPPPCADNIVAFANGTGGSCTKADIDAAGGSCVLFQEPNGTYARPPSRICPDYPEMMRWNSVLGKCLRAGTLSPPVVSCK